MFVSNLLLSGLLLLSPSPSDQPLQRVQMRLVTDEADAVLVILGRDAWFKRIRPLLKAREIIFADLRIPK